MKQRTITAWIILVFMLAGCSPKLQESPTRVAIKIVTNQDGMYKIEASELAKFGVDIQEINDRTFRLSRRGIAQPYWVKNIGSNTSLIFYATATDSKYTNENYYILTRLDNASHSEAGLLDVISDSEVEPATHLEPQEGMYISSLLQEQNLLYLPQVNGNDNWLWHNLPSTQQVEFEFEISNLASDSTGYLQLAVWSNTDALIDPDHHLKLFVNRRLVADQFWEGAGHQFITVAIPEGLLQEGSNSLQVQAPGDLGLLAEMYFVDWFKVDYYRVPVAQNDRLDFAFTGNHLQLRGFSGPVVVYDITTPDMPVLHTEQLAKEFEFFGTPGNHYVAVGPNGYFDVHQLQIVDDVTLLPQGQLGADYLVIGPQELLEATQPLMDLRRMQGLVTAKIPLEKIYDQFNGGFPEPGAITAFLRFGVDNWQPSPRFVLLIGDGSYDPVGNIAPFEANRLPVYLVSTHYGGQTVSDVGYVQINNDAWPDLAIGHVPARTATQVQVWVQKTLSYEQRITESGESMKILAIADGQEASFKHEAQTFLDLLPSTVTKSLYAPEPGVTDASQVIKNYWSENYSMVAYFGHGSINMWGKDRLFSGEDVGELPSGANAPIVVNMTCLTGFYIHPKVESLAETLLWKPGSGAVAVLAPSSLTLPSDQSALSNALARLLVDSKHNTLGEIHLEARRSVPVDVTGTLEVMQTFMLFGDPALRLSHP